MLHSSLLTGVPSIDQEHDALIVNLNAFLNNPKALIGSDTFSEYLSELGLQIMRHFKNEEKILVSSTMPSDEIKRHIRVHGKIIEQYIQLNQDLMAGKAVDRNQVLAMIKEWIVSHVISYDLKIREYVTDSAKDRKNTPFL